MGVISFFSLSGPGQSPEAAEFAAGILLLCASAVRQDLELRVIPHLMLDIHHQGIARRCDRCVLRGDDGREDPARRAGPGRGAAAAKVLRDGAAR